MPQFKNIWDVTPATAHPRATQLLRDSIVWDYGDEDSPLGNDTGADTFAAYLAYRGDSPWRTTQDFICDQLASLRVADADWDLLDLASLRDALDSDGGFSLLRRDDFIIALAFTQLLIDGAVDENVRGRAITALRRQATDVVLLFRGGSEETARKNQLIEFQRVLESL